MTTVSARSLQVLVIEDEPLIAMLLEMAIESFGHAMVGPVARLEDALRITSENGFDCAILDVNIRGGPSYGVADLLIASQRPFLLASGYDDWSLPPQLRDRPRLMKPYSSQQLDTELRQLFDRV